MQAKTEWVELHDLEWDGGTPAATYETDLACIAHGNKLFPIDAIRYKDCRAQKYKEKSIVERSSDRILTTHVGSLPRPADLLQMNDARASGQEVDDTAWAARVRNAIAEVVRLQLDAGIDIVNDGELSKSSWSSYVNKRLEGFAESISRGQGSLARGRDRKAFQEFYDEYDRIQPFRTVNGSRWTDIVCNAPVTYAGHSAVHMDLENLKAACGSLEVEEAFVTAVAPGSIVTRRINRFYPSEEAFLFAIADAMKTEYKAIVDAGFLLQIDDPQLVTRYDAEDPPPDAGQYCKRAGVRVEALNHALAEIPPERIRYHICWGGWHGPHTTDLSLKDIVGLLLQIRAGAYLIEAANARHEHEWHVWEQVKLPEGKILIPGVVSHATNVVEHPELVAERIMRFASVVGRENVIAGTDCGLGGRLHHQLAWAKLKSLSEGARLASNQLWGRT